MNERDKSQAQPGRMDDGGAGQQAQESRQSAKHPGADRPQGADASRQDKPGIGSSQGQDKGSKGNGQGGRAGTADIERDSARSQDSLVNDPTGAYKERP
jgi:hypothetical protein